MEAETIVILLASLGLWLASRRRVRVWWATWRAIRKSREGTARDELRALWRGELGAARRVLAQRGDVRSLLELACLELEATDHEAARRVLARVRAREPARAVLSSLVERRAEAAHEPWLASLERSWKDAGKPDLRRRKCLSLDFARSVDVGQETAQLSATERVLHELMTFEPSLRVMHPPHAVEWAAADDRVVSGLSDVVIALFLLPVDGSPVRRRLLARALELAPDNFWVRLSWFLAERERGPIAPAHIRELVEVCGSRAVDAAVTDGVYERFAEVASKAGSKAPEAPAFRAAVGCLLVNDSIALFDALRATRVGQEQAAEVCVRVAETMQRDRYLLTHILGGALLTLAARFQSSRDVSRRAKDFMREAPVLREVSTHLRLDPWRWPLPSLHREAIAQARFNEIEYYRRLLALPET